MRYQLYVEGILRSEFIYKDEAVREAMRLYRKRLANVAVIDAAKKNLICYFE